jgi:hypothetical protein
MNWTLLLIGFGLAVLMGAGLASLLTTIRPQWPHSRRLIAAALTLPAITAVATLLGLLVIAMADHGQTDSVEDLALAAVAAIGGGLTLLALVGGTVGALVSGRGRRS